MNSIASLVALLRYRAEQHPSRDAYTFLHDGERDARAISYGELDRAARSLAGWIGTRAQPGDRALVVMPPGLPYIAAFFGCLYAGLIAVPVPVPHRKRGLPRLLAIVRDCAPRLALTTDELLTTLGADSGADKDLVALPWISVDQIPDDASDGWRPPRADEATVAFLQYTSGSTGTPKGVVLSHGNLLANQEAIRRAFAHDEESVIVGWLPPHHDMGLIGNILQPLYLGARCIQMAPQHFLTKPARWLDAISRYRATTSGGPNFAFELCARKVTEEQKAGLDLSSWTVAFNGAEPVRAATLDRFAAAFADAGFRRAALYPCYGLAEATLLVTGSVVGAAPAICAIDRAALARGRAALAAAGDGLALVGCGRPAGEVVRIVDPERCVACADGEIGEIWVAGASVARGYWGRPEESARIFEGRLASGDGPFLRTGDLGFLRDGELYVTGRRKDLIIVRGRNLYPEDLELTADESHPGLRSGGGAAFAIERDGEERVAIVHEADRGAAADLAEVAAAIRTAIAARHEVAVDAVVLIRPGTLPRTTSGKVQRHACRAGFLDGTLHVVWRAADAEPTDAAAGNPADAAAGNPADAAAAAAADTADPSRTPLEAIVAAIWAEVLGSAPGRIGREDDFLALGGDSLRAAQVSARIREACGVEVPPAQLFESTTVSSLATWLEERRAGARGDAQGDASAFAPVSRAAPLPLAPVQERLWFLEDLAGGAPVLHVSVALRLTGSLDVAALEHAATAVVARHEALRTRFPAAGGRAVQEIVPPAPIALPVHEPDRSARALLEREARRRFDLAEAPPVRWTLVCVRDGEHVLGLTCHHLVADGWTMWLVLREFAEAYRDRVAGQVRARSAPPVQYADYAAWARVHAASAEAELAYWRERLRGVPRLELHTDRPRPAAQTYAGAREAVALPADLVEALAALARRERITLFAVLAGGLAALLHRYTGQRDLCIGVPVAGRPRVALEDVAGCFVNTLALRVDLAGGSAGDLTGDPTVGELLARAGAALAEAQAHQRAPFERVVEALALPRAASHAPLFSVMLAMQPARAAIPVLPDLAVDVERIDTGTAQLDLTLDLAHDGAGGLRGAWEYNTDLFERSTVARMTRHLRSLLAGFVATPEARVGELPLMDDAERARIVHGWNATARAYPADGWVHEQIEAQAARTPDAVAVVLDDRRVTYRELDARANQLAHALRHRGVGPDVLVAIAAERSVELVVAILGVLKAGGAYVPIDPGYPAERIAFLLEDAAAPVLLTQAGVASRLPPSRAARICLDTDRAAIEREPVTSPGVRVSGDHLAYTIYTSGSTGQPKGAGNTHRGLQNRLAWMQERYGLGAADRVLQKTPFSFDVSVWELLAPLLTGGTLVVSRPGDHRDADRLVELVVQHAVTMLHFVPPMLQAFLEAPGVAACRSLRRVICSGEALPAELARRFFERLDRIDAELHNLYGPTEASIEVTAWACARGDDAAAVPIGQPIANTQIYLLDRAGQPVPIGVPGELYIGGVGVARGYHRRPALTAERFVPDPFGHAPGGRLYRTGDLARYRGDGAIEFLGRLDHQVKLRGLRVELGEIEARLLQHASVRDAVVIAREEAHGDKRLVAYVTGACEASALRAWVAAALPEHMVPAAIVVLAQLPLSPNGKVDRRALPAPDAGRAAALPATPPRTELEREIAALWREVLHLERVGIDDNFFDLGGHSLLLARVASGLRDRMRRAIPMLLLFQHPTIGALAGALTGGAGADRSVEAAREEAAREDDRVHAGRARRAELRDRRRAAAAGGGGADVAREGRGADTSERGGHAPALAQRPGRGESIE